MTGTESLFWRSVSLLLATLVVGFGMSGTAFANGAPPAASKCAEATNNGKYWEYRNFLITGRKKGLAKGNNNVNGKGVKEALNGYLRKAATWDTNEHVAKIESLKANLDGFDEASGLVGYVWLEIAKKALAHYNTNTLADNAKIDIDVWGRINENNVAPNNSENGYVFNSSAGSGHIWATMCFEIRFSGTGHNDDPDVKIRCSLKASVARCGFKIIARGSGNGNSQVFTGSYIKFTANRVPSNFVTKLEAVNLLQGDIPTGFTCPTPPVNGYVTLGAAFFDYGDETWVDLNDGLHTHLFNSNVESCVDMFFETTTPPAGFSVGDARPNYCLGRCSDPPIINSGM